MKKMYYKIAGFICLSSCPHDTKSKIGSVRCQKCRYFKKSFGIDEHGRYVSCTYNSFLNRLKRILKWK